MSRLVIVGRTGPAFREPRSLVDTLQASVDYLAERRRQRAALRTNDEKQAGPLPSVEQLARCHEDLNVLLGLSRWVPRV